AAQSAGLKVVVLEADRPFSTIHNFPKGKPIYTYPEELDQVAPLKTRGSSKEQLLSDMEAQIADLNLPIKQTYVKGISGRKGAFVLHSEHGEFRALRVILAIGKSGNARKLDVPGEERPKVYNRLIDPNDFQGQKVLVVGGGDSAVEAALMLSAVNNTEVTLSYRKTSLSRPKPENIEHVQAAAAQNKLELLFSSEVQEVQEQHVVLQVDGEAQPRSLENDSVLVQIGKELPFSFFQRSGIAMENSWNFNRVVMLLALLFASGVFYFGKSSHVFEGKAGFFTNFLNAPSVFIQQLGTHQWSAAFLDLSAWLSVLGLAVFGTWTLVLVLLRAGYYLGTSWKLFKGTYFLGAAGLTSWIYLSEFYLGTQFLNKPMYFWYTSLYSLTITIFGLRRILVRKTRYITMQTTALILIQVIPLFLLPELVLPWLDRMGWMPAMVKEHLFPGGSYWRAYGFVLAWPLFMWNLISGHPTTAWLVLSLIQTFLIIPLLIWKWGKGAYCGWICSCGGLAETLGDEYRTTAWHGPASRSFEHVGQVVLIVAVALTGWNLWIEYAVKGFHPEVFDLSNGHFLAGKATEGKKILAAWGISLLPHAKDVYKIIVDVIMAGVLGVGVYFFLSGRFWCRFL
ncbi:MAG: NAD(P)-binding domain-containing protein, partial [Myxococcota bacterium]